MNHLMFWAWPTQRLLNATLLKSADKFNTLFYVTAIIDQILDRKAKYTGGGHCCLAKGTRSRTKLCFSIILVQGRLSIDWRIPRVREKRKTWRRLDFQCVCVYPFHVLPKHEFMCPFFFSLRLNSWLTSWKYESNKHVAAKWMPSYHESVCRRFIPTFLKCSSIFIIYNKYA